MLINGKKTNQIEISDRGLQYGDGVWETIPIESELPMLWKAHLQRLKKGLQVLNITGLDLTKLHREVFNLCKNQTKAILKIIITRGSGGRGYNPRNLNQPTRILSLHPYPNFPKNYYQKGIRLFLCQTRLGHNPQLAGFKHLNRLEQVLARAEFDTTYQEGLVLDQQNNVVEGTMSNVFIIKNNKILTPNLNNCGIQGVQRSCIIARLKSRGYRINICTISLDDVKQAEAIFMSNSIIKIWNVRHFAGKTYSLSKIPYEIFS